MDGLYLIVNAGSSSLKVQLFNLEGGERRLVAKCNVERIGNKNGVVAFKLPDGTKEEKVLDIDDHNKAVDLMFECLCEHGIINSPSDIKYIGNRVLHGAEKYKESCIITPEVMSDIEAYIPLGPNHHPAQLAVIKHIYDVSPSCEQVAVFDTAFHQSIDKEFYLESLPQEYYHEYGIRKYGFHGISCAYILETMKKVFASKYPDSVRYDENGEPLINIVIAHIGSGASVTTVRDSKSYNTTMDFTPTGGFLMGTRSGSIDPNIPLNVAKYHKNIDEVSDDLNKKSGLKGITGVYGVPSLPGVNDWREVLGIASGELVRGDESVTEEERKQDKENAILAKNKFARGIRDAISSAILDLDGKVDALVFTAGIGENNWEFRKLVLDGLKPMGVEINDESNKALKDTGAITTANSKVLALVVPTDEEQMILMDTARLMRKKYNEEENIQYVK